MGGVLQWRRRDPTACSGGSIRGAVASPTSYLLLALLMLPNLSR